MNLPENGDMFDDLSDPQFLALIMRYQDGTLSGEELRELSETICRDENKRHLFRRIQLRTAAIHDVMRIDAIRHADELLQLDATDDSLWSESQLRSHRHVVHTNSPRSRWLAGRVRQFAWGLGGGALILLVALLTFKQTNRKEQLASDPSSESIRSHVVLTEEVRASFFGKAILTPGAEVALHQDYMLQGGIVMLKFPSQATAIIEAPSIFRVESGDQLVLNSGSCSVYAPETAEQFEVLTPVTRVSDRGTRYYVNVQDNNETEVHVVEGAADLHSIANHVAEAVTRDAVADVQRHRAGDPVRVANGEAVRVGGFVNYYGQPTEFKSESYRRQLPDRLVDYQASSTERGTVGELQSVTVQREGRLYQYSVEDLIPIQVTYFRADPKPDLNGNLCGFLNKPQQPGAWLEDRHLATGVINFGGQPEPLDPAILNDESAPRPGGLGVRFREPIINHAGPDFVLFEIQTFSNSPEGDPFHVYPVSGRSDLRSHTVTRFDLTMDSPTVREVSPLWSHRFPYSIDSLDALIAEDAPIKVDVGDRHFSVIGVGVDLSDLGYREGETVDELFFQHAADAKASKVDPVFIAGFPPLESRQLHLTQPNPPATDASNVAFRNIKGTLPAPASLLSMHPVARRIP